MSTAVEDAHANGAGSAAVRKEACALESGKAWAEQVIWSLLRGARCHARAMSDLRRRQRDVENALRLAEMRAHLRRDERDLQRAAGEGILPSEYSALVYRGELEDVERRIELVLERRALLSSLLSALPEEEYRVLTMRFIECKSWRAVAERVFVCERHAQRIQKRAIEQMAHTLQKQCEVRQT